jgi:hypothetical protein
MLFVKNQVAILFNHVLNSWEYLVREPRHPKRLGDLSELCA